MTPPEDHVKASRGRNPSRKVNMNKFKRKLDVLWTAGSLGNIQNHDLKKKRPSNKGSSIVNPQQRKDKENSPTFHQCIESLRKHFLTKYGANAENSPPERDQIAKYFDRKQNNHHNSLKVLCARSVKSDSSIRSKKSSKFEENRNAYHFKKNVKLNGNTMDKHALKPDLCSTNTSVAVNPKEHRQPAGSQKADTNVMPPIELQEPVKVESMTAVVAAVDAAIRHTRAILGDNCSGDGGGAEIICANVGRGRPADGGGVERAVGREDVCNGQHNSLATTLRWPDSSLNMEVPTRKRECERGTMTSMAEKSKMNSAESVAERRARWTERDWTRERGKGRVRAEVRKEVAKSTQTSESTFEKGRSLKRPAMSPSPRHASRRRVAPAVSAARAQRRSPARRGGRASISTSPSVSWSQVASSRSCSESEMDILRQARLAAVAVDAARTSRCPRQVKEDTLLWTTAAKKEMLQAHSATETTQERVSHERIGANARERHCSSPLVPAATTAESGDGPEPCRVNVHIRLAASNGVLKAHAVLTNAEGSQFDVPTTVEWADSHSTAPRGVHPTFSGSSIRLDGSFLPLLTSTSPLTTPQKPAPSSPDDAKSPTTLQSWPSPSSLFPHFASSPRPTPMQQQTQLQQMPQQIQLQSLAQFQPQPLQPSQPQHSSGSHPTMLHSQYGRYISEMPESHASKSPSDNRQLDASTEYSLTAQDQPIEEQRLRRYPGDAPQFTPRPLLAPSFFPTRNVDHLPDISSRELTYVTSCAFNHATAQDIDNFPTNSSPNNLSNASFSYTIGPPLNSSTQELSYVPSPINPHATIQFHNNASNATSTNISNNSSTEPPYFSPVPVTNKTSTQFVPSSFMTHALSQVPSHTRASSYPHTSYRAPVYNPGNEFPCDTNYSLIQAPSTNYSTNSPSNAPPYVSNFSPSSLRRSRSNFIPNPTIDFDSISGRLSVYSTAPKENFHNSHNPTPILPIYPNSPNPNHSSDALCSRNESRDSQLNYNIFSQNSSNREYVLEEPSSPRAFTPWRQSSSSDGFQAPTLSPIHSYYQQSPRWIYHKSPTCHSAIHFRPDVVEVYPPRAVQSSPSTIRVEPFNLSRIDTFQDADYREKQNEQNAEARHIDVLDTLLRKLSYMPSVANEKDKIHKLPDAPILPQRSKTEPVFLFSELSSSRGRSGYSNTRRSQQIISQNIYSNNPFLTSEDMNNPISCRHQSMFTLSNELNESSQSSHHTRRLSAPRNAIFTFNNILSRGEERNENSLDKDRSIPPLSKLLNEYSSSSPSFSNSHITSSTSTLRSPGEWALMRESPMGSREAPERLPPPPPPWTTSIGFSPPLFDSQETERGSPAKLPSQKLHQVAARLGGERLSEQNLHVLLEGMRARNQMREMARVQQHSTLTPPTVRARMQLGQTSPDGARTGNSDVSGGATTWNLLHPHQ